MLTARKSLKGWLRGVDLNHRPLGYEPNELPDCSTPQSHPTADPDVTSNTEGIVQYLFRSHPNQ